jgi:hypothetical protein
VLEKLNQVESIEFHNSWAPKAGLPVHDVRWISSRAAALGYPSVQDGLAREHAVMYDELMRAYGKDEFVETEGATTRSAGIRRVLRTV